MKTTICIITLFVIYTTIDCASLRRRRQADNLRNVVCPRNPTHDICAGWTAPTGSSAGSSSGSFGNSGGFRESACRRNPSLAFCKDTITETTTTTAPQQVQCDSDSDSFVTRCLGDSVSRDDKDWCIAYATACDIPLENLNLPSNDRSTDGQTAKGGDPFASLLPDETQPAPAQAQTKLCAEYKDQFDQFCLGNQINADFKVFCPDYAKECGREWEEKPTLPYPPFCDKYNNDFVQQCRVEVINVRYLQFCSDYSLTCHQPVGTNRAANQSGTDASACNTHTNQYNNKCKSFTIAQNDTDYCVQVSRACNWQLGPDVPPEASNGASGVNRPIPPALPENGAQTTQGPRTDEQNRKICKENDNQARVNCFQAVDVKPEFVRPCSLFVRDCMKYYEDDEPLRRAASLFNSRVGINSGVGFSGIPYYPFNTQGNIGVGSSTGVDFGTWGGGFSRQTGVSDFFNLKDEAGANWYEGKYGTQNSWGVPILPFVSGRSGTQVSVPINERNLGQPISVDKGGAVGPFAGWNDGTSVDWLQGNVGNSKGFSLPFLGMGLSQGTGVSFPSVSKFLPLLAGRR